MQRAICVVHRLAGRSRRSLLRRRDRRRAAGRPVTAPPRPSRRPAL